MTPTERLRLGIRLSERMVDLAKAEAQRDALLEALKEARWRIANLVGSEGAQGLDRKALDKIDAAIKAVEGE